MAASRSLLALFALSACVLVIAAHDAPALISLDGGEAHTHVDLCGECCHTIADKVKARARTIRISPTAANHPLGKDPRVSMELDSCDAHTDLAAGPATQPLIVNGELTQAGCNAQLKLTKVEDANGVPHYEGTVQAFTVGRQSIDSDANLLARMQTFITCKLSYCSKEAGSPSRCKVQTGESPKAPRCPNLYKTMLKL